MNKNDPTSSLPVLRPDLSALVIAPPGDEPGNWVGAPSSVYSDGVYHLAYRLRRPIGEGRGYAVAVARSSDGERFETVYTLTREEADTESLERPALVRTPEGRWRLYISCATYGTKHWRVEVMEAADPAGFDPAQRKIVLPGDPKTGVKDPVVVHRNGMWHLWASCHPLAEPGEEDQMVTDYATSADGLEWTWEGTALTGRPGCWDSRGARVTSVVHMGDTILATYDGRASAAENYEERTGLAVGSEYATLTPAGTEPIAESPYGGLRYLDILELPGGRRRLYYEITREDGAHELRTELH
ncbi:hypothetical protein Sme01_67730 [Sphaerisporangium melleum]|uniref:Glycosyl hydrolase family 32 N-terminal domain-containing protein n=1 Tax=Sphaerisporangium melleum TaxID=321316 RepID=A0A917RH58_9ACTN|nr:hypothetical protein [Sphaerisporangium melleum]GGL08045.1 hypothetical protein GCM10007964_57820 [Sphaerisporangium melleum]GII74297.1 hypothetical protein Sme01_67730 [Sphaerisporangium melleum]